MASSIEWLLGGETLNPIRARLKELYTGTVLNPLPVPIAKGKVGWMCVKISPGCERCYAEAQNVTCGTNPGRNGTGQRYAADKLPLVELFLDEKTLLAPLHWKKPRLIFPCSMTDWMADFVPEEWRDKMLAVMALTPQHTYLTLTKRADTQLKYMKEAHYGMQDQIAVLQGLRFPSKQYRLQWPLPNHWCGVSAENQEYADKRIPELLQTPAALRWVSLEPLLGPIDLDSDKADGLHAFGCGYEGGWQNCPGHQTGKTNCAGIDWGVIGLESGSKARAGNIEWIRQLVAQFHAANLPVFVKQLGAKPYLHKEESVHIDKPGFKFNMQSLEINYTFKLKDSKGGDMSEWPKDLQVREYPARPEQCNCLGSWHVIGSEGCTMEAMKE